MGSLMVAKRIMAIVVALVVLASLGGGSLTNWIRLPRINDITTTIQAPPQFVKLNGKPYPESNGPLQRAAYPDIQSLRLKFSPTQGFTEVLKIVRTQTDWDVVSVDSGVLRIEAVATTRLLRFRDDIVIEIRPAAGGAEISELHIRSRSRLGKSDFGANAARILSFMNRVRTAGLPIL